MASLRTFIQTVKLDHIVWKGEIYAVASGKRQAPADGFANHHNCRLGKWYDNEGRQKYGKSPVFSAIERPHQKVHDCGVLALQMIDQGKHQDAILLLKEMEAASDQVMQLLNDLNQSVE
ncbi:MAG: CZB domain-containing protein [Cellvibrionaceae bacterium]|nr:CZB domain-containing protein [Cellvibrionaceae bacterium]MCV6625638.1 CZB domain-containing protein [Cellvibrionaceae bacterium]